MVYGGRSGRRSTSFSAPSTSVGRGSTPIGMVRLPNYAGCPGDRIRITLSSVTCPIQQQRRYMFTREEDLPRARIVWDSTSRTNFKKSLWEALDKAAKIVGSQDRLDGLRPGVDEEGLLGVPLRPMIGQWRIAMRRALPSQTWIWRPGPTQWEGQVYSYRDNLDTNLVLSSYVSSVAPSAYTGSSTARPRSGGEDIRTLI
ncbi:hypothetical protein Taro_006874, partial [Colocasia esculenta]|nr:hypothetical protein [Colocasia esculenta]